MTTNINHNVIAADFAALFEPRNEEEEVKHDAYILMAWFLSEIERVQEEKGISRKELAAKINTSASYLTQVFRNDKPLNFITLAKMKRALNIRFEIVAKPGPAPAPNRKRAVDRKSVKDRKG